jgi:hypothetical protein|nr:MAG TPA: hypothetical protein [Caudoviricetes sp.]
MGFRHERNRTVHVIISLLVSALMGVLAVLFVGKDCPYTRTREIIGVFGLTAAVSFGLLTVLSLEVLV